VTEQSEGGDKSSKASEEQLERANDELRDLQRELEEGKKEKDDFKAQIQELEKKNAQLTQDDQTEEYEDMKSQLLANKITVQQNKKLNELLQKKVERLTASEVSLKKELEEVQRKPKGGHGLATTASYEEEGKEVKDELVLAEQEVKRSRLRIQSLEKQVQESRKETDVLKREVERTKKRDSTDAQLAEGGDFPGIKKPKTDEA
jgi:chromosome segregation ATPase